MKTVFAILFLCSAAVSQGGTVNQSSKPHRECDPKRDMFMSVNGTPYKCQDGKWVVNEDAIKYQNERAASKRALYWALRTRVLTDAEMAEVEQYDYTLVIEPGASYFEAEKKAEFNQALLMQYKIRDIAHRAERCAHSESSGKPDAEKPKEVKGEASR